MIVFGKNVAKEVDTTTTKTKNLGKSSQNVGQIMKGSFTAVLGVIKNVASTIGNVGKKIEELAAPQAEYIEDLNFLENAYGKADNSGKQLLDTLNQMVGYDQSTLIKQVAVYRQMGNALDLDAKVADKLAESLTKMSVDVKSITGQDLQKVASKFQSAMAGNIRAVRAYGEDVTQAGLQQEALRLGIDTQVSSMTRAEKSILTYITMSRQLSTANGDLSRTVNSVSNQWEIFRNQTTQLARLVGGMLIPVLKAVLPVLNGIIMALNTIISMVMSFFGIDAESFAAEFGSVSDGIGDVSDGFDDVASSAGKAGKAAKEAQKSLRGFDKLNVIQTPTSSSGSSGGGGKVGGSLGKIDPKLLEAFDKLGEWDLHLDKMSNKAAEIKDKIMGWLGFTKEVDEKTGKVTYKFGGIKNLFEGVLELIRKISQNPLIKMIMNSYLIGLLGSFAIPLIALKNALIDNDSVWNGFKETIENVFAALQPLFDFFTQTVIPALGGAFQWLQENVLQPFADFIDYVFVSIWEDTLLPLFNRFSEEILPELISTFEDLWNDVIVPGATLLGNVLKPAIDTIVSVLKILWDNVLSPLINFVVDVVFFAIKGIVAWWKTVLIPIIKVVIDILTWLWKNVLEPIVNWTREHIIPVIESVAKIIGSRIEDIKTTFKNIVEFIKDVFTGNWEGALSRIKEIFKSKFKFITDTIANVQNAFKSLGEGAGKIFGGIGNAIGGLFGGGKAEGGIYNNGIWSPVKAYAGGGFPSRGEIFMARETKGPELVGRIGSSTAVLNNDQILEQMTLAVARGISASGSQEKQVNIIAEGDTEGLLNFINFKNASKNRQYGL